MATVCLFGHSVGFPPDAADGDEAEAEAEEEAEKEDAEEEEEEREGDEEEEEGDSDGDEEEEGEEGKEAKKKEPPLTAARLNAMSPAQPLPPSFPSPLPYSIRFVLGIVHLFSWMGARVSTCMSTCVDRTVQSGPLSHRRLGRNQTCLRVPGCPRGAAQCAEGPPGAEAAEAVPGAAGPGRGAAAAGGSRSPSLPTSWVWGVARRGGASVFFCVFSISVFAL